VSVHNVTLAQLPALFKQLETERLHRVQDSFFEAAQAGATIIAKAAPVDMGELRRSVRATRVSRSESRIVIDAPHAGIAELGSRPHWAPLAPLIAWVRRHRGLFATSVKNRVMLRKRINKNLALSGRHLKAAYSALTRKRKYGFGLTKQEVFDAHIDRARSLRAQTRFLRRQYRWRY
jgi:hypothetical protein